VLILQHFTSKDFLKISLAFVDLYDIIQEHTKRKNMSYNGYANYQTWNVCLWIANDEGLNHFAARSNSYEDFKNDLREYAKSQDNIAYETPDGVAWNDSAVSLTELQGFWEENFSKVGS
jgi:hypothetical protein